MFELTREQSEKIRAWQDTHDAEKHVAPGAKFRSTGAIGGAYTWEFTPTSIGIIQKVRCSCGEKIDVTEYDNW